MHAGWIAFQYVHKYADYVNASLSSYARASVQRNSCNSVAGTAHLLRVCVHWACVRDMEASKTVAVERVVSLYAYKWQNTANKGKC